MSLAKRRRNLLFFPPLLAAASALSACGYLAKSGPSMDRHATTPPLSSSPPGSLSKGAAQTPPRPAAPTCFNTQYRFTCEIPEGFVLIHEADGPGEIMTLAPQSLRSGSSTANLSVRAAALGKMTSDQYMNFRVTRDLQGAPNVTHWDKFPASYGGHAGFEVLVERQYANGPFKSRIFGFSEDSNMFLINFSASQEEFESNQKTMEKFLDSLKFAPPSSAGQSER